jgi:hypothetical protein
MFISMLEPDDTVNFVVETYTAELEEWMREHGSLVMREELHLDPDSPECLFWRAGYLHALRDLTSLVRDRHSTNLGSKPWTSKLFH